MSESKNSSRKPRGYWTKERCYEEALKYNSRKEFSDGCDSAYRASKRKGWLDDVCSHMKLVIRKPWTKEECHQEALKYKTKKEFNKNALGAYDKAYRKGWLDDVCSHMVHSQKPKGYWTLEQCHKTAKLYNTKSEFREKDSSCYSIAKNNKWLPIICSHMEEILKPKGYWTKERCHQEALKYKTKMEYKSKNNPAYTASYKKGWLDDVCSHMEEIFKPKGYWTKAICHQEALKYTNRVDFQSNSSGAYDKAYRKGWLDDICSHMLQKNKHRNKKWTYNTCHKEALKYTNRTDFRSNNAYAYFVSRENNWLDDVCSHMEEILHVNRNSSGTFKLNRVSKWTKDECHEEALCYSNRTDFRNSSSSAYNASLKNGWLDDVCSHMIIVGDFSKKYLYTYYFPKFNAIYVGISWDRNIREFQHLNDVKSSVYQFLNKNNLSPDDYQLIYHGYYELNDAVKLEKKFIKQYRNENYLVLNKSNGGEYGGGNRKWSYKKCKKITSKITDKKELMDLYYNMYIAICNNGWLYDLTSHMKSDRKYRGYWTYERCKEEALKYKTKTDFRNNSTSAYSRVKINGWIDDLCSHMVKPNKQSKWTYKKCKEVSIKLKNRSEFKQKYSHAFKISKIKGWLDEFFPKN